MHRLANHSFLLAFLVAVMAPAAHAGPVTLAQLREAAAAQGADALAMGEKDGQPLLSGDMLSQRFEVTLMACSGPEPACGIVRYQACRDLPDHSRIEALEIANAWNQEDRKAVLTAEEEWFGQALCVRLLQDVRNETFGPRQLSDWQIELEDFLQAVDTALADMQAANMLDRGAQ